MPETSAAVPVTALNAAIAEKDTYIAELQESLRRMSTRCANLALEVSTLQTSQTALIERHAAEIARLNGTADDEPVDALDYDEIRPDDE